MLFFWLWQQENSFLQPHMSNLSPKLGWITEKDLSQRSRKVKKSIEDVYRVLKSSPMGFYSFSFGLTFNRSDTESKWGSYIF